MFLRKHNLHQPVFLCSRALLTSFSAAPALRSCCLSDMRKKQVTEASRFETADCSEPSSRGQVTVQAGLVEGTLDACGSCDFVTPCQVPEPVGKKQRTSTTASSTQRGWLEAHRTFKKSRGLNTDLMPQLPTISAGNREQDLISIAWASETSNGTNPLNVDVFVDISQSVSRKPWADVKKKPLPTITTSTVLYWVNGRRLLLPVEHFLLLGWPRPPQARDLSQAQLKDLSGEAMPLPCIAVVIMNIMYGLAGFWSNDDPSNRES